MRAFGKAASDGGVRVQHIAIYPCLAHNGSVCVDATDCAKAGDKPVSVVWNVHCGHADDEHGIRGRAGWGCGNASAVARASSGHDKLTGCDSGAGTDSHVQFLANLKGNVTRQTDVNGHVGGVPVHLTFGWGVIV